MKLLRASAGSRSCALQQTKAISVALHNELDEKCAREQAGVVRKQRSSSRRRGTASARQGIFAAASFRVATALSWLLSL